MCNACLRNIFAADVIFSLSHFYLHTPSPSPCFRTSLCEHIMSAGYQIHHDHFPWLSLLVYAYAPDADQYTPILAEPYRTHSCVTWAHILTLNHSSRQLFQYYIHVTTDLTLKFSVTF